MPSRRQITVTIPVGGSYVEELSKRLTKLEISHNALARQMGVHRVRCRGGSTETNMTPQHGEHRKDREGDL
jgi:hypothetical protein